MYALKNLNRIQNKLTLVSLNLCYTILSLKLSNHNKIHKNLNHQNKPHLYLPVNIKLSSVNQQKYIL